MVQTVATQYAAIILGLQVVFVFGGLIKESLSVFQALRIMFKQCV